jgi:hypothetical protein
METALSGPELIVPLFVSHPLFFIALFIRDVDMEDRDFLPERMTIRAYSKDSFEEEEWVFERSDGYPSTQDLIGKQCCLYLLHEEWCPEDYLKALKLQDGISMGRVELASLYMVVDTDEVLNLELYFFTHNIVRSCESSMGIMYS